MDDRPAIVVGMCLWVVAFVVLVVFFRHDLRRHHAEWWLWSCGVGFAFGFYGLHFVRKRQAALAARKDQEWPSGSPESASLTDPGSCPNGPPTMSIPNSSSNGGGGAGAAGTTTASE